jgi:tripartite ATP-independent transporter DctM subunit
MIVEKKRVRAALYLIEDWICNGALILLAVIPALESLSRFLFKQGIPSSQDITTHLLLVAGCVSGMITTRKKEHLSIGLIAYLKNERARNTLAVITNLFSSFISLILAFCSAVFIKVSLFPPAMISFIPEWVFALALPAGFTVMALRFASYAPLGGKARLAALLPFAAGLFCSLPLICKFIWELDMPDAVFDMNAFFTDGAEKIALPAFALLAALAFAGTPLFIVIGGLALVLFQSSGWEADTIIIDAASALTTSDYIAIPLFTLVGFFLSESRAGERLVKTFKHFFGWFPGGMIIASVVLCAFFTTFTGASGVTILALGGILFTILSKNAAYPERFSIGLLASSGSIGLLFPPSLPLILVGITMRENILHFFAAGALPGILLMLAMAVFGIIMSIRVKIPLETFSARKAARAFIDSFFEVLLPFLLIAGFFSGVLSLVEIGAAALIYVFIIEVCVRRDIKIRAVPQVFAKALPIIGGIFSILALSKALSDYIAFTQAPEQFALWLQGAVSSKWLFLLILNLALLLAGCLMDIFSAIMVALPLVAPLGAAYGIDPLHLGIIFLVNLEAGYLTPPVGLNLFLASYRFNRPFVHVCRDVLPFLCIQLAVVILVTYIPALSTFLPHLFAR